MLLILIPLLLLVLVVVAEPSKQVEVLLWLLLLRRLVEVKLLRRLIMRIVLKVTEIVLVRLNGRLFVGFVFFWSCLCEWIRLHGRFLVSSVVVGGSLRDHKSVFFRLYFRKCVELLLMLNRLSKCALLLGCGPLIRLLLLNDRCLWHTPGISGRLLRSWLVLSEGISGADRVVAILHFFLFGSHFDALVSEGEKVTELLDLALGLLVGSLVCERIHTAETCHLL